jgi:hypothetical protein
MTTNQVLLKDQVDNLLAEAIENDQPPSYLVHQCRVNSFQLTLDDVDYYLSAIQQKIDRIQFLKTLEQGGLLIADPQVLKAIRKTKPQ